MIDAQPQCGWDMRRYLVDMLIEVHGLGSETVLHHSVNIVDRYMSKRVVLRKHYQLLACCALLLACKYDNAKAPRPSLKQCRELCQGAFDDKAFVQMTHHILHTLGWSLGQPQVSDWIVFKCAALQDPDEVEHVAQYLAQVSLYHRAFVGVPSACLAAAVHPMARTICGIHDSTPATASPSSGAAATAADMLDRLVMHHLSVVSPLLNQKFDSPLRSMATRLVQQHASNRLLRTKLPNSSSPPVTGGLELPSPMSPFGSTALAPTCSRQPSLSAVSMTSSASGSAPATPLVSGTPSHGTTVVAHGRHVLSWGLPTDTVPVKLPTDDAAPYTVKSDNPFEKQFASHPNFSSHLHRYHNTGQAAASMYRDRA